MTVYAQPEIMRQLTASGPVRTAAGLVVFRPWEEFVLRDNPIHSIWVADELNAQHENLILATGARDWRRSIEGLPPEEVVNGELRPQRPLGRFRRSRRTRTYGLRDTNEASGVHVIKTGTFENQMTRDAFGAGETEGVGLSGNESALTHLWTSSPVEPAGTNPWPGVAADFDGQLDASTVDADISFGIRAAGLATGHFSRVDSPLDVDGATTGAQTEALFTTAALHVFTSDTKPDRGGSNVITDRYEVLLATTRAANHGNQTIAMRYNADAFARGPWPVPEFVPSTMARGFAEPRHRGFFSLSGLPAEVGIPAVPENIQTRFPQVIGGNAAPRPLGASYSEIGRFTSVVAPTRMEAAFPQIIRGAPPPLPDAAYSVVGRFTSVVAPARVIAVFAQFVRGAGSPIPIADFQIVGLKHAPPPVVAPGALYEVFAPHMFEGQSPPLPAANYVDVGRTSVVAPARVIAVFPQVISGEPPPLPTATYEFRHVAAPPTVGALYDVFAPQVIAGRAPPLPAAIHMLIGRFTSVVAPSRVIAVFPQVVAGRAPPRPSASYDLIGLHHVVIITPEIFYEIFAPQFIRGEAPPIPKGSMLLVGFSPGGALVIVAVAGGFFEQDFFN